MKAGKKCKPKQIIHLIREVGIHISQGNIVSGATRAAGVTDKSLYRWPRAEVSTQVGRKSPRMYPGSE